MNQKAVISALGAIIVGVVAFFSGFGTDMGDTTLHASKDALNSGVEAIVAAVVAAIGGWSLAPEGKKGPDETPSPPSE